MRTIVAVWLGLGLLMALLAVGDLGVPGPYYDEVIQALPSVEFLEGRPRAAPLPGSEVVRLQGRSFPWMTQAYMGALKSQLLIPSFAIAGSDVSVLRLTGLAWSALGLLVCIVFARRAFGTGVALVSGLFLVSDPSFLFISRHDWGSFSLGFLLRCASLLFALFWWESGRLRDALLAGASLGLGLYNKIDFGVFLAAAGLALAVAAPRTVAAALRRPLDRILPVAAGLVLGAAPLLVSLGDAVSASLALLGVDLALLFGFLVFLLNFIPTVGSIVATLLPLPVVLMSPDSTMTTVVLVLAIPGSIQLVIGNVIAPKVLGETLDLHPVTILLALIFWGMLWGIPGMLLATPITAIMKMMFARMELTAPLSNWMAGRFGAATA